MKRLLKTTIKTIAPALAAAVLYSSTAYAGPTTSVHQHVAPSAIKRECWIFLLWTNCEITHSYTSGYSFFGQGSHSKFEGTKSSEGSGRYSLSHNKSSTQSNGNVASYDTGTTGSIFGGSTGIGHSTHSEDKPGAAAGGNPGGNTGAGNQGGHVDQGGNGSQASNGNNGSTGDNASTGNNGGTGGTDNNGGTGDNASTGNNGGTSGTGNTGGNGGTGDNASTGNNGGTGNNGSTGDTGGTGGQAGNGNNGSNGNHGNGNNGNGNGNGNGNNGSHGNNGYGNGGGDGVPGGSDKTDGNR